MGDEFDLAPNYITAVYELGKTKALNMEALRLSYSKARRGKYMDALRATAIGLDRGKQITAMVANDGRVDDEDKKECFCGCPLGVDDIFCLKCMRSKILSVEENGRQDADFTNNIAAAFNAVSEDPTHDPSVLWDSFEAGLQQSIDEVLEKMVPADRLMTMVMRANALDAKKSAG